MRHTTPRKCGPHHTGRTGAAVPHHRHINRLQHHRPRWKNSKKSPQTLDNHLRDTNPSTQQYRLRFSMLSRTVRTTTHTSGMYCTYRQYPDGWRTGYSYEEPDIPKPPKGTWRTTAQIKKEYGIPKSTAYDWTHCDDVEHRKIRQNRAKPALQIDVHSVWDRIQAHQKKQKRKQ